MSRCLFRYFQAACILAAAVGLFGCSHIKRAIAPYRGSYAVEEILLTETEDGVYRGEFTEKPVTVILDVTVSDHLIRDIRIVEHRHALGADAESLVEIIKRKQSVRVDVISGATVSSICILKAVEQALATRR